MAYISANENWLKVEYRGWGELCKNGKNGSDLHQMLTLYEHESDWMAVEFMSEQVALLNNMAFLNNIEINA